MSAAWTIRDQKGQLLPNFEAPSRLDVGRKVVPAHYDPFRLQVSHSYRELFDRAVAQILKRKGWEIVRIGSDASRGLLRAT
jgi:hypothetical protein